MKSNGTPAQSVAPHGGLLTMLPRGTFACSRMSIVLTRARSTQNGATEAEALSLKSSSAREKASFSVSCEILPSFAAAFHAEGALSSAAAMSFSDFPPRKTTGSDGGRTRSAAPALPRLRTTRRDTSTSTGDANSSPGTNHTAFGARVSFMTTKPVSPPGSRAAWTSMPSTSAPDTRSRVSQVE